MKIFGENLFKVRQAKISNTITLLFILVILVGINTFVFANENKHDEITAVIPSHFPPLYMVDSSGKPYGFAIEVMDEVAHRGNLIVNYQVKDSWADVNYALTNGLAHVIPNNGITNQRKESRLFTRPYESFSIKLFVNIKQKHLKSIKDLTGRKAGTTVQNIGEKLIKEHPGVELILFNDPGDAVKALVSGEISGLVLPEPVVERSAIELDVRNQLVAVGNALKTVQRSIAVAKGHIELKERLDHVLEDYIQSREFQDTYEAWFGTSDNITNTLVTESYVVSFFVILIIIYVIYQLLRQANKKNRNENLKGSRQRVMVLVLILVAVVICVLSLTIWLLYETSFEQNRHRLVETAKSRARLIESVAIFNLKHFEEMGNPDLARSSTIKQLKDAHKQFLGFGASGEFSMAERVGDRIQFVLTHRHSNETYPQSILLNSRLSEPMRRALALRSGTIVGLDYRGVDVLAAYEPVSILNMGIVAKIDLAEIRHPFIHASLLAIGLAVLVIILGTMLFFRVTNPIIRSLKESEKKLLTLLNTLPDLVWMKNEDGKYVFCNKKYSDFLDLPQTDIIGKTDYDLYDHSIADAYRENDKAAIAFGKPRKNEEDGVYASGHVARLETIKTPVMDSSEQLIGVLGIGRDITERKKAEDSLQKLAQAVNQSPESIVITNTHAEIEYVNDAFTNNSGYTLEEIIGQNPSFLQSGKTPVESYIDLWEHLLKKRKWEGEFYNRRKDGSEYIENVTISPILNKDKNITHYVAVKEDITEKKRLAKELDDYRYHLEELVEERTKQLVEARKQAEAANIAKSTFLANMSHEIRTPMNGVLGMTNLALSTNLDELQKNYISKAHHSAQNLLGIINDILDFSKIEAGKLDIETTDFNINDVIHNSLKLLQFKAAEKGIRLIVKKDTDVPSFLIGDPLRLGQILVNLLNNALKFSHTGESITLKIALYEKSDEVSEDIIELKISVQDTGIGMTEEEQKKLFQSFSQADSSTTRQYGGTGLGLVICKNIVNLMSGNIWVESKPDIGSTFIFTIQLGKQTDQKQLLKKQDKTKRNKLEQQLRGSKILLVEDNLINQEVIVDILSNAGILVVAVNNGQEAIDALSKDSFDGILMDCQMPVMDGYTATKKIRQMKKYKDLPIIALTANALATDKDKVLEVGMNDHIAKPVSPDDLFSTMAHWIKNAA